MFKPCMFLASYLSSNLNFTERIFYKKRIELNLIALN